MSSVTPQSSFRADGLMKPDANVWFVTQAEQYTGAGAAAEVRTALAYRSPAHRAPRATADMACSSTRDMNSSRWSAFHRRPRCPEPQNRVLRDAVVGVEKSFCGYGDRNLVDQRPTDSLADFSEHAPALDGDLLATSQRPVVADNKKQLAARDHCCVDVLK